MIENEPFFSTFKTELKSFSLIRQNVDEESIFDFKREDVSFAYKHARDNNVIDGSYYVNISLLSIKNLLVFDPDEPPVLYSNFFIPLSFSTIR